MTESNTLIISTTVIVLSIIASVSVYNINDRNLMAKNVETAIAKGIDPLSVRCSYAKSDDIICVAHSATHNNLNTSNNTSSKK